MVVAGTEAIDRFLKRHPECSQELSELIRDLRANHFADPEALRARYPSVKTIGGRTVVFKVRGNRYRLTASVAYKTQVFQVRGMETHAKYDRRRLK